MIELNPITLYSTQTGRCCCALPGVQEFQVVLPSLSTQGLLAGLLF
jgi:hypothetical protein